MMNEFHEETGPALAAAPARLTLAHYRCVQAITARGGITAAAATLGMTPSALGHQLREVERRLNTPMFERIGKRLRPTPAGQHIAEAAAEALPLLRAAEAAAGGGDLPRHVVRIGSGAYSCYRWLPPALARFRDEWPDVDVQVVGDTTRPPVAALVEGSLDVAIGAGPLETGAVRAVPLFRDELMLVAPPDHPLAARTVIAAADLADETYLTYSTVEQKGHEAERFMRPARTVPRRIVTIELTEGICELVAAGFGVSILSRWAVMPYVAQGRLIARRIGTAGLFLDWHAAVRAGDTPDSPAVRLAETIAAAC